MHHENAKSFVFLEPEHNCARSQTKEAPFVRVDPHLISLAAKELLDRHGNSALERARELIESAEKSHDMPALDLALLVLSELEKIDGPGNYS